MEHSDIFVCEGYEISTYEKNISAPIFRKSINIDNDVKSAEISICTPGVYDLFINGEKITKGYLAPYISNPDHLVYYDKYILTNYLTKGENVIAIMLGDGFGNTKNQIWDFKDNIFNSFPKFSALLKIDLCENVIEYNAADFMCKKGPIFFNDIRGGVFYDKRAEDIGWLEAGFCEDETWHKPIRVKKPRGKAKPCMAEPIRVQREIKPVSICAGEMCEYTPRNDVTEIGDEQPPCRTGGYIYDFGENNAGIYRLKIKGKKGQRIDIQCAERLVGGKVDYNNINFYPDGYAQRDIYIVGSEDEEIFEPMFTYHGFRYLYVSGITEEQATEDLITYLVMSSDLEERGSFECSDDMANKIFQAVRRSDTSNFYYFPTDCPHREKNGWTGDASMSAEHMIMLMGAENSWREWLGNIRYAQTVEGELPGIIPTGTWGYEWGNGPAWDSVIFNIPYCMYKYLGDTDIIKENAHMMLSYLEYISKKRDNDGIIACGLGDWLPVGGKEPETSLGFTDSVMVMDMCFKAEEMFKAIGYDIHTAFVKQLGIMMKNAIRNKYIDTKNMIADTGCQSAQAMAIFYNVFEPDEKNAAYNNLKEIIANDQNKLTCGFLGLRVIYHVLAQFGDCELAYNMITGTEFPSYGYWINKGMTTLPEWFVDRGERYPHSENHHFFGDVAAWYMRYIAGLDIVNSENVIIKPCFIENLNYAEAKHILPAGEVKVRWERNEGGITLDVAYPKAIYCKIDVADNVTVRVN